MRNDRLRNFRCNELRMYFTYEFMFSGLDFSNFVPTNEDKTDEDIKRKLNMREDLCEKLKGEDKYKEVYLHGGEEGHKAIKPLLFLKTPHLGVKIKEREPLTISGKVNDKPITLENVELYQRIIVFESGMGVCIFDLRIGKEYAKIGKERREWNDREGFEKEHIIALSRIARIRAQTDQEQLESKMDLIIKNGRKYLYQGFVDEVEKLKNVLNKHLNKDIQPKIRKFIEKREIQWIEKDKNLVFPLIDVVGVREEERKSWYFQDPYIMIFMMAPTVIYQYFLDVDANCEDATKLSKLPPEQREQYYRDVASILLIGSDKTKTLDGSYLKQYIDTDVRLANMCANSKFFMHLDMRIAIAIYDEKDAESPFVESSRSTFFETVNLLRMRWHSYVVTDAWLDDEIRKIYKQFRELQVQPRRFGELLAKQQEIITLKSEMLGVLQDPITYQTSSGSSVILYKRGIEKFRIKEIQDIVLGKMRELDKLYDIVQKETEAWRIKGRLSSFWKWFIGLIGVGVIAFTLIFGLGPKLGAILPRNPVVYLPFLFIIATLVSFILVLIKGRRT